MKRKIMSKLVFCVFACLMVVLVSSPARSENITITTGKDGMSYKTAGNLLGQLIVQESSLSEVSYETKVVTSKGGVENMSRLVKHEANVGFVPADALQLALLKNPDLLQKLKVLGVLYTEHVFIVVPKNGKVKNEDYLQNASLKPTISIGEVGAGNSSTWTFMCSLEAGYKASKPDYRPTTTALSALNLASGKGTKMTLPGQAVPDAVLFVCKNVATSTNLMMVAKNKNLRIINVNDGNLNDTCKLTGKPVYRFESISVPDAGGFFSKTTTIKTLAVDSYVIGSDELSDTAANLITSILVQNEGMF